MTCLFFDPWRWVANQTIYALQPAGQGATQMFVRAVWRNRRLVDIKQTRREVELPTARDAVLFGMVSKDFPKMTRGLFDR